MSSSSGEKFRRGKVTKRERSKGFILVKTDIVKLRKCCEEEIYY